MRLIGNSEAFEVTNFFSARLRLLLARVDKGGGGIVVKAYRGSDPTVRRLLSPRGDLGERDRTLGVRAKPAILFEPPAQGRLPHISCGAKANKSACCALHHDASDKTFALYGPLVVLLKLGSIRQLRLLFL
jgi:hypothetical protein